MPKLKENIDYKIEEIYDSVEDSSDSIQVEFEKDRKLRVKNQADNTGLKQGIEEDCEGWDLNVKIEGKDIVITCE